MQARPHEPQVGSLVTKPIHFPRSSPGGALPRLAIFPVVRALVNYFGMLIVHHAIYACRLEKLASHPLRLSTPSALIFPLSPFPLQMVMRNLKHAPAGRVLPDLFGSANCECWNQLRRDERDQSTGAGRHPGFL